MRIETIMRIRILFTILNIFLPGFLYSNVQENVEVTEIGIEDSIEIMSSTEIEESGNPIGQETQLMPGEHEEIVEMPDIYYPEYEDWEKVTIQGKLKMKGLPLSPGVKIFMEKDSSVYISLTAPFLGEVGRLEAVGDSLTVLNKMNQTYVGYKLPPEASLYMDKMGHVLGENQSQEVSTLVISMLQDLLLGRFFLPGHDVTEEDLDELVEIVVEDGRINVVPTAKAEIPGIDYGFIVDENFRPQMVVVLSHQPADMEVDAVYTYYGSGNYDLMLAYVSGGFNMEATFEMKKPEWKGESPKRIDIRKYKKLSPEEFIRQIGR